MDRFFSKLDLRDIKIDPERTRFSPDDEFEPEDVSQQHLNGETQDPFIDPAAAYVRDAPSPNGHVDVSVATDLIASTEPVALDGLAADGSGVLKVSSKSRPSAVAGAIAGVVREFGRAEVQAIGAGATNQAIKAVAIARDYLSETGIDAVCLPAFIDIIIENEDRTAIRLVIEPR